MTVHQEQTTASPTEPEVAFDRRTLLVAGGVATTAWALPNSQSLVGVQLRLQVVGIELAAAGIDRITSTNALDLTIGAL